MRHITQGRQQQQHQTSSKLPEQRERAEDKLAKHDILRSACETYPSLDSGVLVGEETEIEMPRLLPVKGETIHTLRRISCQGILEEEI